MHESILFERTIYSSLLHYAWNQVLFPLKMVIPQPVIKKVPTLTSNEDIRVGMVLQHVRGKLLDIGCGANRLVRDYRARGGEGTGVDVYDWGSVDVVVENTAQLPFPDKSFETISFVACLNHIPNREEVLREACRLLAPQGRVLVTNLTPVVSRIWHRWAFWDEDQHERGMAEGEVFGFTTIELEAILRRNGLTVVGSRGFSWGLNRLFVCSAGQSAVLP